MTRERSRETQGNDQANDTEPAQENALESADVCAEYDAMSTACQMKRQMIAMRTKAGLTQEQMAQLLGTKKSNISRLESVNAAHSPNLATVEKYAAALGYSIKVEFEPVNT